MASASICLDPADGKQFKDPADTAENSIRTLLKKAEKSPDDYFINVNLGWLYYNSGKYANAIHHYKLAVEKNKWSLEARMGCYLVTMALAEYEEAEKHCRAILEIDPLNYYGTLYLANSIIAQKKFTEARTLLFNILAFYPSDPEFNRLYLQLVQPVK